MIFTLVFTVLIGLFTAIFSVFPSFTGPSVTVESKAHDAIAGLGSLGYWIPLQTLFTCLGVVLGAVVVAYTGIALMWLYDHFPGKAT